jgi:hypothetical protein
MAQAAIGAGASLLGGILTNKAAGKASKAQQQSFQQAQALVKDAQGQYLPWLQAGAGALGDQQKFLSGDWSGFENSPAYKYALDQMIKGSDRSAAARGGLYSGGHQLDLAQSMNGIASQNAMNYWNQLQQLSGGGMSAAGGYGDLAGSLAGFYTGQGQAKAQGINDKNNNWLNTLGGLTGAASDYFGGRTPDTTGTAYGGGANASQFGLPTPVDPYANTNWGWKW